MRSDQRQFSVFDLEIGLVKEGGIPPTINAAIDVWQKMKNKKQKYDLNNSSASMVIGDIEAGPDLDYVVILIRLSDTKAPNSVYSDISSDYFEEHEKLDGVGADAGCHVFISRVEEKNLPNVYTCAVERVPGLSSGLVKRMLSKFLHIEFSENKTAFQYPAPGGGLDREGKPRVDRACPHVKLRGRPSTQFINDLNNGVLTGVKLVKSEVVTPVTGAAYLLTESSELRLQVVKGQLPARVWNSLKLTLNSYSKSYGRSEVSYKLPNSRRIVTVEFDNDTCSPINELYIQSFDVMNIFPPLAQSSNTIIPRLRDGGLPHFLDSRTI